MTRTIEPYDFFTEYAKIVAFITTHSDYDPDDNYEWLEFFESFTNQNYDIPFIYKLSLYKEDIGSQRRSHKLLGSLYPDRYERKIPMLLKRFQKNNQKWLNENVNGFCMFYISGEYDDSISMLFTSKADAITFKMMLP